jgi:CDP-6-deoxy-D-xylo-4-hexulose-3-dehydrase
VHLARQFAWWGRDCYCVGSCNQLINGSCGKRFDQWLEGYDGVVDHKYVFSQIGYNLKPIDLQGAIGQVQLTKFDEIHEKRRANYERTKQLLNKLDKDLRVVEEEPTAETSWFGVPIVCFDKTFKRELQLYLEANGIQTRNYFAGNLLLHPAYKHLGDAKDYPNGYDVLSRVFFMSTAPILTDENFEYIDEIISSFGAAY